VENDHQETMSQALKLANNLLRVKMMHDIILEKKASLETEEKIFTSRHAFVLEGWIQKNDFVPVKNDLGGISDAVEIIKTDPKEGEIAPTIIRNQGILSPFELVTRIFALPRQTEIDPTPALSFFFILFFGICLGDFGYGIVLTLFSFYFLKRYKLPEGGKKLFLLLVMGGIASAIAGIATGSYFGYTPPEISAAVPQLKDLVSSAQIIDPVKDPLRMLFVSLGLGLIQIFLGKFLSLFQKILNGQYLEAIIDDAFWIFLLASLVLFAISSFIFPGMVVLSRNLSIVGAALLIISQGRNEKNIIKKALVGILSLYSVSAYLGDILSYSRLLALGMTSAIIGSVINILANMARGAPLIGGLLMFAILVFGHLFNLIISTLGAFVHSLRLQMVEFFGKFYEGGGKEFKPLRRAAEYTVLRI
jgi:V/A-type H+-transporting ATPase subunit I